MSVLVKLRIMTQSGRTRRLNRKEIEQLKTELAVTETNQFPVIGAADKGKKLPLSIQEQKDISDQRHTQEQNAIMREMLLNKARELLACAHNKAFLDRDYDVYDIPTAKALLKLFNTRSGSRMITEPRSGDKWNVIDGVRVKLWNTNIVMVKDLNSFLAKLNLVAVKVPSSRHYPVPVEAYELQRVRKFA